MEWWLADQGFFESWVAWEAGERGPQGLELELVYRAAVELAHKAWLEYERRDYCDPVVGDLWERLAAIVEARYDRLDELKTVWAEAPPEARQRIRIPPYLSDALTGRLDITDTMAAPDAEEARYIIARLRGQPQEKVEKFLTLLYGSADLTGQVKATTPLPAPAPGLNGYVVNGVNDKRPDQGQRRG
jgi:hypothetical protein